MENWVTYLSSNGYGNLRQETGAGAVFGGVWGRPGAKMSVQNITLYSKLLSYLHATASESEKGIVASFLKQIHQRVVILLGTFLFKCNILFCQSHSCPVATLGHCDNNKSQ